MKFYQLNIILAIVMMMILAIEAEAANKCTYKCKAMLGTSAAAGAIGVVAAAPMIMGFGINGIVAQSAAAGMQAGVGNVAAGSAFAAAQSAGASGTLAVTAGASGVGAAASGVAATYGECYSACFF